MYNFTLQTSKICLGWFQDLHGEMYLDLAISQGGFISQEEAVVVSHLFQKLSVLLMKGNNRQPGSVNMNIDGIQWEMAFKFHLLFMIIDNLMVLLL